MTQKKSSVDVFAWVAMLAIAATIFIFARYYFARDFVVFMNEEQIAETVMTEFPYIAEFMFADYL